MARRLINGAVFLHAPKTGGTFITNLLRKLGLVRESFSHEHADIERAIYPHDTRTAILWASNSVSRKVRGNESFPKDLTTFCFIRHPISWYESWWKYNKKHNFRNWGKQE